MGVSKGKWWACGKERVRRKLSVIGYMVLIEGCFFSSVSYHAASIYIELPYNEFPDIELPYGESLDFCSEARG